MHHSPSSSLHRDRPVIGSVQKLADRNELAAIAFERTRMPMVVTNPRQADNPIVLANQAFLDLTGYAAEEVVGRNCRFLQGNGSSPVAIAEIRAAVAETREVNVEVLEKTIARMGRHSGMSFKSVPSMTNRADFSTSSAPPRMSLPFAMFKISKLRNIAC